VTVRFISLTCLTNLQTPQEKDRRTSSHPRFSNHARCHERCAEQHPVCQPRHPPAKANLRPPWPHRRNHMPPLHQKQYAPRQRVPRKTGPVAKSSDADGWVVLWDMATRRPATVWKAHDASVLSIRDWGSSKLIT
jgi:hypothetical protein